MIQDPNRHAEIFALLCKEDLFVRQLCKWASDTPQPDPLYDKLAAMPTANLSGFQRLLLSQVLQCMDKSFTMPEKRCTANITLKERMQLTLAWLKAAPEQQDNNLFCASLLVAGEILGNEQCRELSS
jgi:hypothetical protein